MNKFDGKDFNIFIEGVDVFGASDGTISITSDRLPGGNKGDGGFQREVVKPTNSGPHRGLVSLGRYQSVETFEFRIRGRVAFA